MSTEMSQMTSRKLLALASGLALALGVTACDPADITSTNNDPNAPTVAPAPAVFTGAIRLLGVRWFGTYNARQTSVVAQHLAEVQYPETDQYKRLAAGFTEAVFNQAYFAELADFQQVIAAGERQEAAGIYGPAMVMSAWTFGNLTDAWGDVPYSEALAGDSGTVQPAYDAQKDIYAGLLASLAKASTDMAAADGAGLDNADPIYGGDLLQWQRFANSLRARHALRLSNVDPTLARTEFLAAVAAPGGLMTSNADNAQIDWPGDGVYDNQWSLNFQTRDDHRVSNRLTTWLMGDTTLTADDDPRLAVYAQPADADGQYRGAPNALTQDEGADWVDLGSRPGTILYPGANAYGAPVGSGADFPSFIMSYAEVAFMQAEAAQRGWLATGTARQYYENGIRASMAQWGVTNAAAIGSFLTLPRIAYAGGTAGLKQIATQKWVALYTDGAQAWAEWRRTCQPSNLRVGPAAVLSQLPRRLQYSTTELSVNSASVAAAVARQGADALITRMYWDTAPTAAPTYESAAVCGP